MKLTERAKEVIAEYLTNYFYEQLEHGWVYTKDNLLEELCSYVPEAGVLASEQGYEELSDYLSDELTNQLKIKVEVNN